MASIYVIDDNKSTCIIIQKILEQDGHAVRIENDPKKAEEFLSNQDNTIFPDVVFLDLVMPVKTGYELLDLIKKNRKLENTKIILLTSKDDQANMMKSYDLGVDYFMTKPANNKQILFALETVLNSDDTLSDTP